MFLVPSKRNARDPPAVRGIAASLGGPAWPRPTLVLAFCLALFCSSSCTCLPGLFLGETHQQWVCVLPQWRIHRAASSAWDQGCLSVLGGPCSRRSKTTLGHTLSGSCSLWCPHRRCPKSKEGRHLYGIAKTGSLRTGKTAGGQLFAVL